MQLYPALELCGGYNLYKCVGSSRKLVLIESPDAGHCPGTLCSIGQSRLYIKPLQRAIPLVAEVRSANTVKMSGYSYSCD